MRPRVGSALWLAALSLALVRSVEADDGAAPADADLVAKLGDPATRDEAANTLVAHGAAAVPALVAGLADAKTRPAAIDVVARIGPAAKAAVPALVGFARNPTHSSRLPATRALGLIGAEAAPALSALGPWVADPKATARADAALAIERILVDAARVAPAPKGPPSPARKAIDAGCDWLMRHQTSEGGWSCLSFPKLCKGDVKCGGAVDFDYEVGVGGLATLALLGAGDAEGGPRRTAAVRGAEWIASLQDKEGYLSPRASNHSNYCHLIGGLALADTLRVTGHEPLRISVKSAVAMTQKIRSTATGGWRYDISSKGDSDTSLTVWGVKFLKAAQAAGVAVDEEALKGGLRWIDSMTEDEFGRTGYQQHGGPPARTNELMQRFPADQVETLTACGIDVRLLMGHTRHDDPLLERGLRLLAKKPPSWTAAGEAVDMYYWTHASVVERGVGGADYVAWRKALVAALVPHQCDKPNLCARGSWEPADPWCGEAGRIYSTAMPVLALEACIEDPAERPAMPTDRAKFVAALEKAAGADDAPTKLAALHALDAVHDSYR